MIVHLLRCGHCPNKKLAVRTYAEAESQGWRWSEAKGWTCPAHKGAKPEGSKHDVAQNA